MKYYFYFIIIIIITLMDRIKIDLKTKYRINTEINI